jgi:hypothetical protein
MKNRSAYFFCVDQRGKKVCRTILENTPKIKNKSACFFCVDLRKKSVPHNLGKHPENQKKISVFFLLKSA